MSDSRQIRTTPSRIAIFRLQHKRRGGILITTLVFSIIIAFLLAGIGTFTISHLSRESTEANYTGALDLAEAGVDYELRKVSSNTSQADQYNSTTQSGVTYTLGNGSFTIYCENSDGTVPWTAPNDMYIICTGALNGVNRNLKVMCKGYVNGIGNYAMYAMKSALVQNNFNVTGNVGTNGKITFDSGASINGTVALNGSGASVSGGYSATSTAHNANPVAWPTVHNIALQLFPQGGLSWLASNNDNGLVPQISNNKISASSGTITFKGKAGGANYYLTSFNFQSGASLKLDNSLGPITIWLGPDGAAGGPFTFQSDSTVVSMSSDPSKACKVYCASSTAIDCQSGSSWGFGLYDYNTDSSGNAIGSINMESDATFTGEVIANTINFQSNTKISDPGSYFYSLLISYYGFANSWQEQNGM